VFFDPLQHKAPCFSDVNFAALAGTPVDNAILFFQVKGKTAVDLNSATGSLLGAILALVIFCTKEEGYPLETSTDDRCFYSPVITAGLVTRRLAQLYDTLQYRALLTEGGVNHTYAKYWEDRNAPITADPRDINGAAQPVDPIGRRRPAASRRNVSIHIVSDHIVRQTILQFIIIYHDEQQQPFPPLFSSYQEIQPYQIFEN